MQSDARPNHLLINFDAAAREQLRLVLCGYIRAEKQFVGETWLEDLKSAISEDVRITECTLSHEVWQPS
eukprot:SAG31_NODE_35501_length_322_cov_0.928251_1_plen_68_part_10